MSGSARTARFTLSPVPRHPPNAARSWRRRRASALCHSLFCVYMADKKCHAAATAPRPADAAARPADAAASPAEDGAAASPAEDGAAACPAEDDDAGSDAVAIKEDGALPSAPAGPARPGAARNGSARRNSKSEFRIEKRSHGKHEGLNPLGSGTTGGRTDWISFVFLACPWASNLIDFLDFP